MPHSYEGLGRPSRLKAVGSRWTAWITRDENSNKSVGGLSDPRNRKVLICLLIAIPPLGTTRKKQD